MSKSSRSSTDVSRWFLLFDAENGEGAKMPHYRIPIFAVHRGEREFAWGSLRCSCCAPVCEAPRLVAKGPLFSILLNCQSVARLKIVELGEHHDCASKCPLTCGRDGVVKLFAVTSERDDESGCVSDACEH